MFDNVRRDFDLTLSRAESTVSSALSDVSNVYWDDDELLQAYEDGAEETVSNVNRFSQIADKIEEIYSDTMDAIANDLEDYGIDASDVADEVVTAFVDNIRDDGWDTLAESVDFSYY